MTYTDTLKDAFEAIKFQESGVTQLRSNSDGVMHAVYTMLIAGALATLFTINPVVWLTGAIAALVGGSVGIAVIHLFAVLLGGQASFQDYFAVIGNAYMVNWATVIPFLAPFVGLYYLVLNGWVLTKVHKLSVGRAVFAILLPAIIVIVIFGVFAFLFGSLVLGGLLSMAQF